MRSSAVETSKRAQQIAGSIGCKVYSPITTLGEMESKPTGIPQKKDFAGHIQLQEAGHNQQSKPNLQLSFLLISSFPLIKKIGRSTHIHSEGHHKQLSRGDMSLSDRRTLISLLGEAKAP